MKEKKDKLAEVLEANMGAEVTEELAAEITGIFTAQKTSTKINEDGEVFCNYFEVYMPSDEFHVSPKGKIDSMSKEGKTLHRAQKSRVNKATTEVLAQFRSGEVTADEMSDLLEKIDANAKVKFEAGTELPEDYPFAA